MLTVACVRVPGADGACPYGPEYVERLRNGVARHLKLPHRFVCIGDDVLAEPDLPGWWQKVALFNGRFGAGRVLYLDLDTIPIDDLAPLIERPGNWIMQDPWQPSYNSSVMVWDAGTMDHIWTSFRPEVMDSLAHLGDQAWISVISKWRTFPPTEVTSYKASGGAKLGRVSVFHGRPKPHECDGWVKEEWR